MMCTRVYATLGIGLLIATTVFVVFLAAAQLLRPTPPTWAECVELNGADACAVALLDQ